MLSDLEARRAPRRREIEIEQPREGGTEAPASLQREIVGRESTRERRERREREEQHINEMQWDCGRG